MSTPRFSGTIPTAPEGTKGVPSPFPWQWRNADVFAQGNPRFSIVDANGVEVLTINRRDFGDGETMANARFIIASISTHQP